jgi:hypothetical protein
MSWDIYIQNFPAEAKTPAEIPNNYSPQAIGSRDEIISKIREVIPTADFSNKAWGVIEASDFSIEVHLGDKELLTGFALFVRGSDMAAACVADILRHLNLRAIETGSGSFFDIDQPTAGMQKWRDYRNQIISKFE